MVYAVITAQCSADQARLPEREEIHCQMKATITPPRIAKIQVLSSKKLLLTSILKIAEAIQPPRSAPRIPVTRAPSQPPP